MSIKCIYKPPRIFVQNIRLLPTLKYFFYVFEFSYFKFPILLHFCCRLVAVPVTPKKEGQEIYIPQQRNCIFAIQYPRYVLLWKKFIQFVSIIVIFSCIS